MHKYQLKWLRVMMHIGKPVTHYQCGKIWYKFIVSTCRKEKWAEISVIVHSWALTITNRSDHHNFHSCYVIINSHHRQSNVWLNSGDSWYDRIKVRIIILKAFNIPKKSYKIHINLFLYDKLKRSTRKM